MVENARNTGGISSASMIQGLLDQLDQAVAALSNADELRLAQIRLAFIYDALAERAAATRTCPGPYWRKRPEVQEAMEALNKQGKTKRPRYDMNEVASPECAKYHQAGTRGFERSYIGPPRDHPTAEGTDTRRTLCENCGQLLNRDRQNGVLAVAEKTQKEEQEEDGWNL